MITSEHPSPPNRRRRRVPAIAGSVALVFAMLTGCVTNRGHLAGRPEDRGPEGPACHAAAHLTDRLEVSTTTAVDPAAVAAALLRLGERLPDELRGYVGLLLSPDDVQAPDGSDGHETAWRLLETWSVVTCESRLLPASLVDQPDLGWIDDEEWRPGGAADNVPAHRPTDVPPSEPPPPTFEDLVLVLATQRADGVPWYAPEVTGMVGRSVVGTSVAVLGVASAALALVACEDLHEVLGDAAPVDVVVRGSGGELLALTDEHGCRTSRGS